MKLLSLAGEADRRTITAKGSAGMGAGPSVPDWDETSGSSQATRPVIPARRTQELCPPENAGKVTARANTAAFATPIESIGARPISREDHPDA